MDAEHERQGLGTWMHDTQKRGLPLLSRAVLVAAGVGVDSDLGS